MGIRITEQGGDQHTQNPPPEQDATLGEGQTKTVASVTVDAATATPTVLRGTHYPTGLCPIEVSDAAVTISNASRSAGSETSETNTQSDPVAVPALGWVRRDTGATQQIGPIEDHIVRKLPPRWTIAPTSVTDQVDSQNNKIAQ